MATPTAAAVAPPLTSHGQKLMSGTPAGTVPFMPPYASFDPHFPATGSQPLRGEVTGWGPGV